MYILEFVDNAKGQVNDFSQDKQPDASKLIKGMESNAQLWNDLLWSSGGALEYIKYTFDTINWEFYKGYPMLQEGKAEIPQTL